MRRLFVLLTCLVILTPTDATVDDAISRALEAIEPYVKQGYTVHQDDEWGGDLGVKEQKAIAHLLFEGNDYWFCMGTDVDNARVAIHVYDNKGRVAEVDARQNGPIALRECLPVSAGTVQENCEYHHSSYDNRGPETRYSA